MQEARYHSLSAICWVKHSLVVLSGFDTKSKEESIIKTERWKSVSTNLEYIIVFGKVLLFGQRTFKTQIVGMCFFVRCVTHLKRNLFGKVKIYDRVRLADDLRNVFRSSDSSDSVEKGWQRWNEMCAEWGSRYKSFKIMQDNLDYRDYFTYLAYDYRIRGMIYTTNWIERLQRDFRRVLRQRSSMPGESVIILMGKVSIEKKSYRRAIPKLNYEKSFFFKAIVVEVSECEILENMLD